MLSEIKPKFTDFVADLRPFIPSERIITDSLRTLAFGTDASFYRLIPQVVVTVENEDEVVLLLQLVQRHQVHITFRAAGTSLSGQAITDGILVRLSPAWNQYQVLDDGKKLKVQPGITGAKANQVLAPFQRKIGPDPASINTAKIGGIAANNASGMCCGIAQNSYQTLASMKIILADGTKLDTADNDSRQQFMMQQSSLITHIEALRDQVILNTALHDRIIKKFKIKNTMGYSLNALVDFHDPIDILQHLMIGSEGTLGFISEMVYHTVEDPPYKASALLIFPDIEQTSKAVTALSSTPVAAVELMDRPALRSVQNEPGMPDYLQNLNNKAAALLVEVQGASKQALKQRLQEVESALVHFTTLQPKIFTQDDNICQQFWKIRKGLFPAIGAIHKKNTSVIIEDVAFPVEKLAPAVLELQALFSKYHYNEAIIFGHALTGNLHFVFTQNFSEPKEIQRYANFIDEICTLIVGRYDGSLKAEHGTGRNMAPFVEIEWGSQAYKLMQEIKKTFDPNGLLNPDVILTTHSDIHIQNLKSLPEADDLIDRCIECGFCEPVCPSRNLTLTPRQRIVVMRELKRQQREGKDGNYMELLKGYQYLGIDTCATCGLCSIACPVEINTGDLTRKLRSERNAKHHGKAQWVVNHFAGITSIIRTSLKLVNVMPSGSKALRNLGMSKIPLWHNAMPSSAPKTDLAQHKTYENCDVVYFPSCVSRTMGPAKQDKDQRSLMQVTLDLARKAGIKLAMLPDQDQHCCGMPLESKGHFTQANEMRNNLNLVLLIASGFGRIPVLIDTSPCVYRMQQNLDKRITLLDPIRFANIHLIPRLIIHQIDQPIAVHITCSTTKSGLSNELINLAKQCSSQVIVPDDITCCGFAGDKGFVLPELNASALKPLQQQVSHCVEGISTSRTCEIGLSRQGEISYHSLFYLLDRISQTLPENAKN